MAKSVPAPAAPLSVATLLTLAWPMVVSRSSQVLIGLSDSLMVAHLGEASLAATTAGGFNSFALLILPMGMVFIVSSFVAQLVGAGERAGARRYAVYGLGLALATQALCLLAQPLIGPMLAQVALAPDVRALMAQYMAIRLLSGGAAIGIEALAAYYGGTGNTRLPMAFSLGAMVLNVALNWLLIGGRLGAPALGVAGSAWASTFATWATFAAFALAYGRDGRRAAGGGRAWPSGLRLAEMRRVLAFGLPSGLNWFFEFFAFNVFINVVVAGLGTATLAAFMAVFQVNSVSFMPAFAVASAGAILVGQMIGAGQPDAVPRAVKLTWSVAAAWQGLVSVAYLAVPVWLLSPFVAEGAASGTFMVVGVRMLRLSVAWQLLDATTGTLAEALRAAGDTAFAMWARVVLAWGVFIPGAWYAVRVAGHGDVGAVAWIVIYMALLTATLCWRFWGGAWRRVALVPAA